jgi:hypothetical protein
MKLSALFFAAVAEAAAIAVPEPGADGRYTISAEGIKAQVGIVQSPARRTLRWMLAAGADTDKFIPYGATLTNLFVKDKNGKDIDVVLGYDDVDYYRQCQPPI